MKKANYQQGWTLVELMVTVALIGIIAAIAVPAYNDYIVTSQHGAARANAEQLALFEEAYFYENDSSYLPGTYDPSTNTDTLTGPLGWQPAGDRDLFRYVVVLGSCATPCYTITVTMLTDTSVVESITRP